MNRTSGVLHQIFAQLSRAQLHTWQGRTSYSQRWGREPSPRALELWEHLINYRPPVSEDQIEQWFLASGDGLHVSFSSKQVVMYLPPLRRHAEFVPVLDLECHLSPTSTMMKLGMTLICLVEDGGERKPCGISFRLENSHREQQEEAQENEEGTHDFYHAQLVKSPRSLSFIEYPTWVPDSQPSFPLTAECPVTLVLCLLLTLYGKKECWDFVSQDTAFFNLLKSYVSKLQPWIKWKELP